MAVCGILAPQKTRSVIPRPPGDLRKLGEFLWPWVPDPLAMTLLSNSVFYSALLGCQQKAFLCSLLAVPLPARAGNPAGEVGGGGEYETEAERDKLGVIGGGEAAEGGGSGGGSGTTPDPSLSSSRFPTPFSSLTCTGAGLR